MARNLVINTEGRLPTHNRSSNTTPRIKYTLGTNMVSFGISILAYAIITVSIITYGLYFVIWGRVLQSVYDSLIDMEFFGQLTIIILPMEIWILLTTVAVFVWTFQCIVQEGFKISLRHPVVCATATYISAMTYAAANICCFFFHQFVMKELLKCQEERLGQDLFVKFREAVSQMLECLEGQQPTETGCTFNCTAGEEGVAFG